MRLKVTIYIFIFIFAVNYENMEEFTVQVADESLRQAAQQGMDEFLSVFINAMSKTIGGELNAENMNRLNGYQITLFAYHYFRKEVLEGGFVQLIYNGYGPFIFENPFAKAMRLFGEGDFSKLIYKAKEIYDAHKEDLIKERSDDDFMALYERYESFDDLEDWYIENEEKITSGIAAYVDDHIDQFALIINKG